MPITDAVFECAQECARLSHECNDREIAAALFEISARLFSAATKQAEAEGGRDAIAERLRKAVGQ